MKPAELFEETGYALKPGVFSAHEISAMRGLVDQQYKLDEAAGLTHTVAHTRAKYAKGDLLSKKMLRHILLDARIVQMARDILGSHDIVYFGDSTYQIGTGSRGFHRDCVDRAYNSGPDWQGQYNIIRVGIYLQDHKKYSGGLKIQSGSHIRAKGKTLFIDSQAGDVVAWSLKTLHSGNAVRLRGFPYFPINNSSIENRIPEFMKREQQQERMSLFMTFGVNGPFVDRYIREYMLRREDVVRNLNASTYEPEALNLVKVAGIELIQPLLEVV